MKSDNAVHVKLNPLWIGFSDCACEPPALLTLSRKGSGMSTMGMWSRPYTMWRGEGVIPVRVASPKSIVMLDKSIVVCPEDMVARDSRRRKNMINLLFAEMRNHPNKRVSEEIRLKLKECGYDGL